MSMVLTLFFTRNVSLKLWLDQGLFDREKLIYEEYLKQGRCKQIYWLTYGSNDSRLAAELKNDNKLHPGIIVIGMPKLFNFPKVGSYIYSFFIPFLYPKIFQQTNILKTNQMDGSWCGVFAKWLYNKPLVVRTGYSISQLLCNNRSSITRCTTYKIIEKYVYKFGDLAIVSSYHNRKYIEEMHGVERKDILVLYNYINLDVFFPRNEIKKYTNRVLYVGRLNPEKNLFNLIEAISNTGLILDVYGTGEQPERQLREFATECNAAVNFYGVVHNNLLSAVYNQYSYYVLPSYHEGMPKTLLEAMSSGCLCIGTDVPGINEIIVDGVNGILSRSTSSHDICKALQRALYVKNKDVLIQNGIRMIKNRCALNSIVQKEFKAFTGLLNAG